jgi:glucose-1-phosphate adenylyltransferase
LQRCIVERGVQIPENTQIGYDLERDHERGFTVTDSGLVVVGRPDMGVGDEDVAWE